MSTTRSTWWSVTAFKPDEIDKLKDNQHYPTCIKTVFGGLERCPETNREHFQGAIQCHQQQRMSAFKTWLPTAHLEPAHYAEALRKYAMKADTAIEEKKERTNPTPHFSCDEIMLMAANEIKDEWDEISTTQKDDGWKIAVNRLLRKNTKLAGQLQNPSNRAFWILSCHTWVQTARQTAKENEEERLRSLSVALVLQQRHSKCKHGIYCVGCDECEGLNDDPRLEIIYNGSNTPTTPATRVLEGIDFEEERSCEGSQDTQGQSDRDC